MNVTNSTRATKYMKQKLTELKEGIDKSQLWLAISTFLSVTDRTRS